MIDISSERRKYEKAPKKSLDIPKRMKFDARNDYTGLYTTNPRTEEFKPDRNPNSIVYNQQEKKEYLQSTFCNGGSDLDNASGVAETMAGNVVSKDQTILRRRLRLNPHSLRKLSIESNPTD